MPIWCVVGSTALLMVVNWTSRIGWSRPHPPRGWAKDRRSRPWCPTPPASPCRAPIGFCGAKAAQVTGECSSATSWRTSNPRLSGPERTRAPAGPPRRPAVSSSEESGEKIAKVSNDVPLARTLHCVIVRPSATDSICSDLALVEQHESAIAADAELADGAVAAADGVAKPASTPFFLRAQTRMVLSRLADTSRHCGVKCKEVMAPLWACGAPCSASRL